jgi:hypothetical protein
MRMWTKTSSRTRSNGFLTSERRPRFSVGIGGGSSSFFAVCDSCEADEEKGRSGEALCLIRVLLRVDTIDLMRVGRIESNILVAEMGISHEKARTFIHCREPHQVVTVRQRNEGKVQCVA